MGGFLREQAFDVVDFETRLPQVRYTQRAQQVQSGLLWTTTAGKALVASCALPGRLLRHCERCAPQPQKDESEAIHGASGCNT